MILAIVRRMAFYEVEPTGGMIRIEFRVCQRLEKEEGTRCTFSSGDGYTPARILKGTRRGKLRRAYSTEGHNITRFVQSRNQGRYPLSKEARSLAPGVVFLLWRMSLDQARLRLHPGSLIPRLAHTKAWRKAKIFYRLGWQQ